MFAGCVLPGALDDAAAFRAAAAAAFLVGSPVVTVGMNNAQQRSAKRKGPEDFIYAVCQRGRQRQRVD